jgi:uncharacterized delta-60 repeat protein
MKLAVTAVLVCGLIASSAAAGTQFGHRGKRVISGLGIVRNALPYGKSRTLLVSSDGVDRKLTRLRANGSIDRSFGSGGHVDIEGEIVAVQQDGKILVLSTLLLPGHMASDPLLTRLLPDGQVDRAFGNEGRVQIDLGNRLDTGSALAVLPDGGIAIAGMSGSTYEPRVGIIVGDPVVARLDPEGALDKSFGVDGRAVLPEVEEPAALKAGPHGTLYLQDGGDFKRLIRLNASGAPDESFGLHGVVGIPHMVDPPETFFLTYGDFAVLPGGGVVIGGTLSSSVNGYERNLVGALRLRPDGSPNPGFGDGGFARVGIPHGSAFEAGVAATRDARVVIVATAQVPIGGRSQLAAIGLTPKGKPNRRFGHRGRMKIGFHEWTNGEDLFLRGGKALLVGSARGPETLLAQVPLARSR